MKILVMGAGGYVGIGTAVDFMRRGHEVTMYDVDASKVDQLRRGELTIYEPGLQEVFENHHAQLDAILSAINEDTIKDMDMIYVTVPTPSLDSGHCNVEYVESCLSTLQELGLGHHVPVVIKSTVAPGTCMALSTKFPLNISHNPEFLREGMMVEDITNPDRIVVGTIGYVDANREAFHKLYAIDSHKLYMTDVTSAEFVKYASNSMLATRISFMNQLARMVDSIGGDIRSISTLMGMDSRIGPKFLNAGIGFGGSCFPKDVIALSSLYEELKSKAGNDALGEVLNGLIGCCGSSNGISDDNIFATTLEINETQEEYAVDAIKELLDGATPRVITVWGRTFKGETDDMRYSVAPKVATRIQDLYPEAVIKYHDSVVNSEVDKYDILKDSDLLLILTEHQEYKELNEKSFMVKAANSMRVPRIFDGKNILCQSATFDASPAVAIRGIGYSEAKG